MSRTGPVQAPEYVHKRGFAAAARAHDRKEFSASNLQAYASQSVHASFAEFVVFVQLFDAYYFAGRRAAWVFLDLVDCRHPYPDWVKAALIAATRLDLAILVKWIE
jgi:hypothetical protein